MTAGARGAAALRRENDALRARFAALGEASLRIDASRDLAAMLQEVVDTARVLTDARYASIATIDEFGAPEDFVTSGVPDEVRRRLLEWPDGPKLFEHLRDLEGPLRLEDFSGFLSSFGFSAELMPFGTVRGVPMRHRGAHVGNFYLVEKEGGRAFTDEDEETLVLLAAQTAAALANARTYRAERQARAGLEALVETSPVGVLVFDATTGHPVSINGEARRILEGLRLPGRPLEELMGLVTCRFAERREVALQDCPIGRALSLAEAMRNEELVLSVPDGRSVRALVNITPIPAGNGAAGSVVATLQDLAPLDELDRQRSAFLGMVSHELRSPLAAIKGSASAVLDAPRPFAPAETREFFRIIAEQADRMFALLADLLDAGRLDAGTLTVSPEPTEVAMLVDRARNTFVAGGRRHTVLIDLPPDLPRVMADRQRVEQVLNNLLINAARHAPESTPIRVEAGRDGVHVAIAVVDEGRGIAPERVAAALSPAWRDGRRRRQPRARPRHLQGTGRVPWRAYPGGERRTRPGRPLHLHPANRRRDRCSGPRAPGARPRGPDHPRGGRRPADAAPCARRARGGRLLGRRDRRAPRARADRADRTAGAGVARSDAAGHRRHRTDADRAGALAPAGHLHLELRPRRDRRAGAGSGRGRLHRQAVLADRAGGAHPRGAAPPRRPRALRSGRTGHRLRPAPGDGGRAHGRAHPDRVRAPARAVAGAGRVVSHKTLLDRVWGDRFNGDRKVLLAFVKQLRAKLGDDASDPTWIFSVRGVGYRMPGPDKAPAP